MVYDQQRVFKYIFVFIYKLSIPVFFKNSNLDCCGFQESSFYKTVLTKCICNSPIKIFTTLRWSDVSILNLVTTPLKYLSQLVFSEDLSTCPDLKYRIYFLLKAPLPRRRCKDLWFYLRNQFQPNTCGRSRPRGSGR